IAGQRVQVEGRVPGDGRGVGAADAAQVGGDAEPAGARKLRLLGLAQVEHGEVAGGDRGTAPTGPDQGVGGDRAEVLESEHGQPPTPSRYSAERGSGTGSAQFPGAIRQRSTRQPRWSATWERRASGLT